MRISFELDVVTGSVDVKFPNLQAVVQVFPQLQEGLLSLPQAVGNQPVSTTANLRASRRGNVLRLNTHTMPEPIRATKRKESMPRLQLSPKGWRELETLYLDIKFAIEQYHDLVRSNKKKQAKSATSKELLEGFRASTGYEPDVKATLGRLNCGCTKTNKLIRDGKGEEYLNYIRKLTRIANSEMVKV